jgi:hypothetical protein
MHATRRIVRVTVVQIKAPPFRESTVTIPHHQTARVWWYPGPAGSRSAAANATCRYGTYQQSQRQPRVPSLPALAL